MAQSPADLFFEWLSERPAAARMAVAVDGDRLLADAGLLGKERLTDSTGRQWRLVVFRGDDVAFRLAYRHARSDSHILVVLARGTSADSRINVSYVTDILAGNEGGEPLDLSVPAVFRRLCPKINFPVPELRQAKETLLDRIDRIPEAANKIIERWHRPDDWGRGQVAALVLLVRHPDWTLRQIWPDELDPADAIAHALRVLLSVSPDSADLQLIRQLLPEAVRQQVKPHLFWLDQPVELMAAYLLIRKFADDAKLQNPVVQLNGLQVFPMELPVDRLEPLARQVIAALRSDPKAWRTVETRAEEFITPRCSEKLASLIAGHPQETGTAALSSPALLLPYVQRRLLEFLADPDRRYLTWVTECQSHPAVQIDDVDLSDRRKQCQAIVRLGGRIHRIESRLAETVPQFSHAEQMLDWYIQSGHHMLELEAARALHDWHECTDEKLFHAAGHYLLGGDDELSPVTGSLVQRVRERLDKLDLTLSNLIGASPDKFAIGPRSFVSFIKDEVGDHLQPILTGDSESRVWVLIFDGMRYDTWEAVVQPLLGEHFHISGQPRFCTLPSYTLYARRSVLAGGPPSAWATGKNPASRPEPQLLAENVGLAKHEVKDKVRLVTDADTTKARSAMTFKDTHVKPLNVLIYPISDDCHDYRGDLASFNSKIRQDMVGDRNTGIRGILDDLLRRVKPGDIILATSDHGFIELLPGDAVSVGNQEVEAAQVTWSDAVHYRYAKHFTPAQLSAPLQVDAAGEPHSLCVGRTWLKREGVGNVARYSHGGVSFAELVVPAVRLDRVTEKLASVEIADVPPAVAVDEDQETELTFTVRNRGNVESEFEVTVRSNLDPSLLEQRGPLLPAATQALKIRVCGTYRTLPDGATDSKNTLSAIGFRLRHTDQSGKWRDAVDGIINVPVKVHAKKTKLATDALAGFDEV